MHASIVRVRHDQAPVRRLLARLVDALLSGTAHAGPPRRHAAPPVPLAAALIDRATVEPERARWLLGEVDGIRARVCEISDTGARIELSFPIELDLVTFRVPRGETTIERPARVVSYRRHPDGPASYGLEFSPDR